MRPWLIEHLVQLYCAAALTSIVLLLAFGEVKVQ